MACICQYFVVAKGRNSIRDKPCSEASGEERLVSLGEENTTNGEVSASELVAAQAEIWQLKKHLGDAEISIENLEHLVKTTISKQNELRGEMCDLKRENCDLRDECRMQRDYQTMERNAMMRQLHDIKRLLGERSKLLEETVEKNSELTNSLQDAHEKIYMMGMKFLKLKASRYKMSSSRSSIAVSDGSS